MFNFEKQGRKIARIKGGNKNGDYIYLSEASDIDKLKDGFEEIIMDKDSTLQPLPKKCTCQLLLEVVNHFTQANGLRNT